MTIKHESLIKRYIESKANAWSPTTLRAEAFKLRAMMAALDGNPERLWASLAPTHSPYTRAIYWVRATQYWDWLVANNKVSGKGPNPYAEFRKTNARLFNGVYQRKAASIGLIEARDRINRIDDPHIRAKALELLGSGMRFAESLTLKNGGVVGKGGKQRKVYFDNSLSPKEGHEDQAQGRVTYGAFYLALKKVGLKPHDLRKIYAAELVKRGANPFQLCKVMGWSNLNTAQSYIEASDDEIKELMRK